MFPTPDLGTFRPQFLGTQYDWMFRTAELGTFPSLDLGTQPKPIRLRSQVLRSDLYTIYNSATQFGTCSQILHIFFFVIFPKEVMHATKCRSCTALFPIAHIFSWWKSRKYVDGTNEDQAFLIDQTKNSPHRNKLATTTSSKELQPRQLLNLFFIWIPTKIKFYNYKYKKVTLNVDILKLVECRND